MTDAQIVLVELSESFKVSLRGLATVSLEPSGTDCRRFGALQGYGVAGCEEPAEGEGRSGDTAVTRPVRMFS